MIRPVLTEIALFLTPFAIYAAFLWGTRSGVMHPASWSLTRIAWLLIAAFVLMIGSFVVLAHWGGEPPGSKYVPAHSANGHVEPGPAQ
jgi:hypothetical protein